MAKKYSKENIEKKQEEINKAYELHTDAVEKLVTAEEGNVPEVTEEELKNFRGDKLAKIPVWVKAIFIKYWFYGALFFFFIFGLGTIIGSNFENQLLVFAVAGGAVIDLIVNNIFAFFDDEGRYLKWTFFYNKKFWSVFINVIYCGVLFFIVSQIYQGINTFIVEVRSLSPDTVAFSAEPFGFAFFCILIDLAFIGIKLYFKKLIDDANKKLSNKNK